MTGKGNGIVLSIKREHAIRIFEGSKQFELRKSLPTCEFRRVYLYESGGRGIIGCFDPVRVLREEKEALWRKVNNKATTHHRFQRYFEGWPSGCAIEIANPIPFRSAIPLKSLRDADPAFRAPMSAVVVGLDSPLGSLLERERVSNRRRMGPNLTLVPIAKKDRATYQRWVTAYIGDRYEGIDETFAARNLDVHDLGHDPAGFFTERKQVLSIMEGYKRIGFTTITWKNTGCAKTGPTILGKKYRGRGLGGAARRAVERLVRDSGYRKIYCTCADNAHQVIGYLLNAGMKIEAHLDRQYSGDHGELVFGKFLVAEEYVEKPPRKRDEHRGEVLDLREVDRTRLRDAMIELFSRDWTPIGVPFAERILKAAVGNGRPDARHKAKRIVCMGEKRGGISAMTILLPKRGGAVKALLSTATKNKATLQNLIEEAARLSCTWGSRKIYFLHPMLDLPVVAALREAQFQMEGFLRAPYAPGEDVGIFSRFC